jgi:hypothetical protein
MTAHAPRIGRGKLKSAVERALSEKGAIVILDSLNNIKVRMPQDRSSDAWPVSQGIHAIPQQVAFRTCERWLGNQ